MKYFLALIVSVLLSVVPSVVNAATVTLQWTFPTTWTNGTPLAPADIVGANLYCGLVSHVYTSYRSTVGLVNKIDIDTSTANYCAYTTIAKLPNGNLSESAYSNEWSRTAIIHPTTSKSLAETYYAPLHCGVDNVCFYVAGGRPFP